MKIEWKYCWRLGLSGLLLFLAIHYWPSLSHLATLCVGAATPLILGFVLAYMINIPMTFLERKLRLEERSPKLRPVNTPICLLLTFLLLAAVFYLVGHLVVPELVRSIRLMFYQVTQWAKSLEEVKGLNELYALLPKEVLDWLQNTNWESAVKQGLKWLTTGVGGTVNWVVSAVGSVFSRLVTWALALVFTIYLLVGRDTLLGQCRRLMSTYLKPKQQEQVHYVMTTLDDSFRGYIVSRVFDSLILGVMCSLGMGLLRLPYALAIGTLVGVTALIPVAGAYIGAAIGALLILTVSPWKALVFLIFLILLQQVEGNLIYPKLVGTSLGLPGVWVLAAVTVGGGIMGVLGMLLSVPIAATLYRLLRTDMRRRRLKTADGGEQPEQLTEKQRE